MDFGVGEWCEMGCKETAEELGMRGAGSTSSRCNSLPPAAAVSGQLTPTTSSQLPRPASLTNTETRYAKAAATRRSARRWRAWPWPPRTTSEIRVRQRHADVVGVEEETVSCRVGPLGARPLPRSLTSEQATPCDASPLSPAQLHLDNEVHINCIKMLALEAIYGDNLEVFGEKSVPRSFQIHVHCETPDGISVSAELQDVDDYTNNWFTFSVKHLAPISLTCLMPPSYPSHHPPYFTLSAQWLDSVKVSSLCHMLDSIWAQQPGQEVVFEWVQWLQSSMLSHLGFDGGIMIRQCDYKMDPVDVRAVGDILSVEDIVEGLISYNQEQCHNTFLRGLHICTICLHEYAGVDFIKLPCLHYFCSRCMETYSKMHVDEGSVLKLVCPDDKCGGFVPPNLLKRLLGDADFERWERLIFQKTLDSMADIAYCPRCETPCLGEDEDTAQCSNCHFSFCTRCRNRRHIGTRCITTEEKLLSLQEREKVPNLSKGNTGRKVNMANEIFSIKEILRSCVACPHCGIAISRASGCNHILCRNCDKSFCYSCGKALNEDHTSEQCKIDREKLRVKVEVNDVVKKMQKDLRLTLSRAHPCSNCHQPNFKVGNNNHIFCGTCQIHYCALCQKRVYKSTEHYGPRGCKQHTVDFEFA